MNEEIRVVIIDDEPMWLRSIKATLIDFGYSVAGCADNFENAVAMLRDLEYDIALIDISLHRNNKGLELGRMIRDLHSKPFIFITGNTESHTIKDALEAKPSAYLTKPVHPVSLVATLQSAINNFNTHTPADSINVGTETEGDFFFIKQGNRYKKIEWQNVVYLRSDKNYTIVFNNADKTEYFIRSTLFKTLNLVIPSQLRSAFVQVNRAEAVNIGCIGEMTNEEVRTGQHTFTITETYASTVRKAMNIIT